MKLALWILCRLLLLVFTTRLVLVSSSFLIHKGAPFHSGIGRRDLIVRNAKAKAKTSPVAGDDGNSDPIDSSNNNKVVRNLSDGGPMLDGNGTPVTVDRILATQPLRKEILTRPGPGGMKLSYLAGDTVISTLNQVFGHDGWNLQVLETQELVREQNKQWEVTYLAHVRITLTESGCFREDYGTGSGMDYSLSGSVQLSLKASITDAVKRAARHFGDKLGNCLYRKGFATDEAPETLLDALEDQYYQERGGG